MNYLAEIRHFYDWLETESLPSNAIVLWHALMFTANREPRSFSLWLGVFSSVLGAGEPHETRQIDHLPHAAYSG